MLPISGFYEDSGPLKIPALGCVFIHNHESPTRVSKPLEEASSPKMQREAQNSDPHKARTPPSPSRHPMDGFHFSRRKLLPLKCLTPDLDTLSALSANSTSKAKDFLSRLTARGSLPKTKSFSSTNQRRRGHGGDLTPIYIE